MELHSQRFVAEILDPRKGFEPARKEVELRRDPLTGQSCRILPRGSLPRPERQDLEEMARSSRESCPFCGERVEEVTPRLPAEVWPDGRIRVGEAVLFPNLVPYAKWSSVSIYSPGRHLLPIGQITPGLMEDNLAAQAVFIRAVRAHDPDSVWASINANFLPPSGSSILHPHLQGAVNPTPTTVQRLLAEQPEGLLEAYLEAELAGGRGLGSTGPIAWVAAFAPVGPAEIRALVPGVASPEEMDDHLLGELARGLCLALGLYDELGFQSFNLACYGGPAGGGGPPLFVRLVARACFGPLLRSDVMWSERLHWEAATDVRPEEVARIGRRRFA
ncbi:MAG TPA: hypothetical protein VKB18_01475 [Gemmatimonadota bacterium]|nr:hypothetical protein [Gemmatimonadota bacterium]